MVNICESLINVVKRQQAKDADRLEPKGTWSGTDVFCSSVTVAEPPADRRDLTHAGTRAERGKPAVLLLGKQAAKRADRTAGKGRWKKRRPFCNGMDRDCANSNIIPRKSGQTSIRSFITREFGKSLLRKSRWQA